MYTHIAELQIMVGGECHEENKAGPGVESDLEVGGGGSCREGGQGRQGTAGRLNNGDTKTWGKDVPGRGTASAKTPKWRQQGLGAQKEGQWAGVNKEGQM